MDLHKLAEIYAIAADQYDAATRAKILNEPVMENALPFKQVAEMTIQHLNSIDPNGENPAVKSAAHSLMDIINNFNVPSAEQLLSATNSAFSLISANAPTNKDAITTSKYLTNLAKIIVYKYFQNAPQANINKTVSYNQPNDEEPQQRDVVNFNTKREPLWKFLGRAYQSVRGGKTLSPVDTNRWNSEKATLTSRLNALNSMKTRTPSQEQERGVIAFLQKQLG